MEIDLLINIKMAAEIENEKLTPNQSPSNSQGSSTHPPPPPPPPPISQTQKEGRVEQEEETRAAGGGGMESGGSTLPPDNNNTNKPNLPDSLQCFTAEEISKYNKYEADYASYLRAKFFSNKDINGGDIFDLAVTVGNEPIKASRSSPTQSYADPQQSFDFGRVVASGEHMPSASGVDTSPNIPNGSLAPQKKST